MTERFTSESLDLSRLPAPDAIEALSFETILDERLASLKERWTDLDTEALETEPAVYLEQEDAYRELLCRAAINDAVRAVLLPSATGTTLEVLAAYYGVSRVLITPANEVTGAPAVYEDDASLRLRTQLAPEALPYAGLTGGGYRSLALKAATAELKNAIPVKRPGGHVDIVLLGRTGDGSVLPATVSKVAMAFQDDEATQLTDIVSVMSADILNYSLALKLILKSGPAPAAVKAAAQASVRAYVTARHDVGAIVYEAGIVAAAKVGGVENVVFTEAFPDLDPGKYSAAYCNTIAITHEVIG